MLKLNDKLAQRDFEVFELTYKDEPGKALTFLGALLDGLRFQNKNDDIIRIVTELRVSYEKMIPFEYRRQYHKMINRFKKL